MIMSLSRVSKTSRVRLPAAVNETDRKVKPPNRDRTYQLAPVLRVTDKKQPEHEQTTWASKIKDVTLRLSRPTISSSLKRVGRERSSEFEKNSQFWHSMRYCSMEYQKKFSNKSNQTTTNRPILAMRPQNVMPNVLSKRPQAEMSAPKLGNNSSSKLPSLTSHQVPSYRL